MASEREWEPEGRFPQCGRAIHGPRRHCQSWRVRDLRRLFSILPREPRVNGDKWKPERPDRVWRCFGVRPGEGSWGQDHQTWWATRMRDAHIVRRDETAEVRGE